jgi:hypothetical protein
VLLQIVETKLLILVPIGNFDKLHSCVITNKETNPMINTEELKEKYWTQFKAPSTEYFFKAVAELGKAIPSRKNSSNLIDRLEVRDSFEINKRSMSAIFGRKAFPFHTDGAYIETPPRYIAMRSPYQIKNCPTILLFPKFSKSEIHQLEKNVWLVNGGRGKFYSPIIQQTQLGMLLRFDLQCMKPALDEFLASREIMEAAIAKSITMEVEWKKNDCMVFDNWKLLHSRADAENARRRIIERIWIKN